MDRAGGLVSQFRRRAQLDERLDQLARYQVELEDRSRRLADRQLLPVGVLAGLGAVFVVGVVLILAGLFLPASIMGSMGWALAMLGLAGSGMAAGGKVLLERIQRPPARRLPKAARRAPTADSTGQRAIATPWTPNCRAAAGQSQGRLQAAEKDLAALEELTPLDTRRSAARQEAESAARRVRRCGGGTEDRPATLARGPVCRRPCRKPSARTGAPAGAARRPDRRATTAADTATGRSHWPAAGIGRPVGAHRATGGRRRRLAEPGRPDGAIAAAGRGGSPTGSGRCPPRRHSQRGTSQPHRPNQA